MTKHVPTPSTSSDPGPAYRVETLGTELLQVWSVLSPKCPVTVCPFLRPLRVLTRTQNGAGKPKLAWTFCRAGVNSVPIISSKDQG